MWPTDTDLKLNEYDASELPGQQLLSAHAHSSLDHLLNLDITAPPGCLRLTGVACFIGPATSDIESMETLIRAGMNIAIVNFMYGTTDENVELIKSLRQAAKNFGAEMGRACPLAIGAMLAGRKIRTGKISSTYGDSIELRLGQQIKLTTDETYKDKCSIYTIYVDYLNFATQIKKKDIILLDNEEIMLTVEMVSASTITCKVERGGILGSYKDVFVPNRVFQMPNFTEKDKVDIGVALKSQVDILISNFVNSVKSVEELRGMLGEKGKRIAIVANIQTAEGFRNFDSILAASNCIMITRQELGTDISPKKLVVAQKNMIARANKANIPIWVSGHMLTSMRQVCQPFRAEVLDVANCILDGADCLVLSAETAVGSYPLEALRVLTAACKEAEACVWTKQLFYDLIDKTPLPCDAETGAAVAAVMAAQRAMASAIIVLTTTGKSAQLVSKYKPRCPVVAVTRYAQMARQMHMWRGLMPLHYEDTPDPHWQLDIEKRISFCTKWALEHGFIRIGDALVVLCGWQHGVGNTNTMRVIYAAAADSPFAAAAEKTT